MDGKEAEGSKRGTGILSGLFWLALFLGAGFVAVQTIAPQTIGEQARRYLQLTLQEHYPQFQVSVGRGRYSPSVGLVFEDLRITDPTTLSQTTSWGFESQVPVEILSIRKLTVVANTDPQKLLQKQSPLVTRRVVIEGVAVQTWLESDGKPSVAKLWPLPVMGPAAPRVEVRDAQVRLIDLAGTSSPFEVDVSELLLTNQPAVVPQATTQAKTLSSIQTLRLLGTSDLLGSIDVQARGSRDGFQLAAKVNAAHLGPALLNTLPEDAKRQLQFASGLDCLCDINLELTHQPPVETDQSLANGAVNNTLANTNYRLTAAVSQGRFDHPALPQTLTQLSGKLVCRPSGLTIQGMQGSCGGAICRITSGSIDGYRWPNSARFNASINDLNLDDRLARSIPASMRRGWENLQPSGQIDIANAAVFYRDGRWVADADIDCKGVSVRYAKFPYPIEQLVGRVAVRDSIAFAKSINGRIGGRPLRCEFRLPTRPEVTPVKFFQVETHGPIAIDATMLRALTARGQPTSKLEKFVRSLNAGGTVQLTSAKFETDVDGINHREVDFRVADGHMQYSLFPYPLYNVNGEVKVVDEEVRMFGFTGTNANAGQIACDGVYWMPKLERALASSATPMSMPSPLEPYRNDSFSQPTNSGMRLTFLAKNIPMDESLRASLPPTARDTWDGISPSGVLDDLQVVVTQSAPGDPIGLNVTGRENQTASTDNRTLSIQPTSLPYRLDITDANVNYDGSRVSIYSLRAKHGGTRIAAKGGCAQDESGRWRLALGIDSGSRISPDAELIAALPADLRSAMYQLQLRRPLSVRGPVNLFLADASHPDPIFDWDVVFQLEGNRIGDVGPVHDLRGELSSKGVQDERGVRANGVVRIDSMHIDDLQVTGIHGPYSVVGEKLRLGADPQPVMQVSLQTDSHRSIHPPLGVSQNRFAQVSPGAFAGSRKIRGKIFGGEVELKGDVVLTSGAFDVSLLLNNGRVPDLLSELGKGQSEMTGTINGQAELEGLLGTTELLKGIGSARVVDANVYQLPLLVQLLNLLRIKATEDVAFTDADVEFSLVEDEITFNDLKLWGDLVALQGGGTLDRRRELDLTFNTQVSPHNAFTQILRPLRKQNYTLWTVDVRGPLDAPVVQRSSRDGVGQTLDRILPGRTVR